MRKQWDILAVPGDTLYDHVISEKPANVIKVHLMDKHILGPPTKGVASRVDWLKEKGYPVAPKRIRRLFKLMGQKSSSMTTGDHFLDK